METHLFDYKLPNDRIAQQSVEPRDHAKLLIVDRATQTLEDRRVFDLPDFLKAGDLLIFNNSKVFKARLRAQLNKQTTVELFLLRPTDDGRWSALAKPGKKLPPGTKLTLEDGTPVTVTDKKEDGTVVIDFHLPP
ncbi:MAG: S-adenosylmethionine:tRNA ribosyltransferase-isomerase, partial [bacterium]|nr:S-adenosylmethionine:tRNA ribosyltransferase-isomerase [bacterium]